MFRLVLKKGIHTIGCHRLGTITTTIGRAQGNHVIINDADVSRRHARIEKRGADYVYVDTSTNGTLINNRPSKMFTIKKDDVVSIGAWKIEVSDDSLDSSGNTNPAIHCKTKLFEPNILCAKKIPPKIEIKIEHPEHSTKRKKFTLSELSFGSHPNCNVTLSDTYVSRQHCRMIIQQERVFLTDLASTNGTFINGTRIDHLSVPFKGDFTIGQTKITYVIGSRLEKSGKIKKDRMGEIIGNSKSMRRIFSLIEKTAPTDATVCIIGASGTGKELIAKEVFNLSHRKKGPFIAINCAAIPATIIEGQLFGHERGAFTSAVEKMSGFFEQARGGTLFLDEIGEMPIELQSRLLRVLETKTIRRIGGQKDIHTDFRLITATNQNLKKMVAAGKFREDLFFRLYIVPINVPSLKERRCDIPALANHFLRGLNPAQSPVLTNEALQKLIRHSWPGNVRELKNTLERSFISSNKPTLDAGDIIFESPSREMVSARDDMDNYEQKLISNILDECYGNVSQSAIKLGVSRSTLQRKMVRYNMRKPG